MKYIRTKDGRILKEADCAEFSPEDYSDYMQLKLKEADTIEKLCDQFVVVGGEYRDIFKRMSDRSWDSFFLKTFSVYGAVWTDKGLIYVAKMNEEGEWKLL